MSAIHPTLLSIGLISGRLNLVEFMQDAVHVDNFWEIRLFLIFFIACFVIIVIPMNSFVGVQVELGHDSLFLESSLMLLG